MRQPAKASPKRSREKNFSAPIRGLTTNEGLAVAKPGGALVLENWICTASGIRARGGSTKYATITSGDPVLRLWSYDNAGSRKFFASDETNIFDITTVADAAVIPTASVTGQTSGYYSTAQFATAGGTYLYAVNGDDAAQLYDGTNWYPITDEAIYGLAYDALSGDFTVGLTVTGGTSYALAYDAETANFTVGQTLTGGTSSATAEILQVTDNGTTGTLLLGTITGGPFQDNEVVTDGLGGSADANIPSGVVSTPATAEIVKIVTATATTGTLWVRGITGIFQDDDSLTDTSTGAATANIPSGVSTVQTVTITGIDTSALSFVWSFASRLFFIEKDTMSVWYLPVDSIGGAASEFSLAGVFRDGGSILFGGTWSLDSGDGLDDKCVFVSTTGEVAVYQGTNPGSAADWQKVGVYRVAAPLGPNATMQAGGDLMIATKDGIVPISEAVNKDVAALSISAVTRNIWPDWQVEVARRPLNWEIVKWPENSLMMVSMPSDDSGLKPLCYAANLQTGAWSSIKGWDMRCMGVFRSRGYFGSNDGKVYSMETGGMDDGQPYQCTYVGSADHLGSKGAIKTVGAMRATFRSDYTIYPNLSVSTDYRIAIPSSPANSTQASSNAWGAGIWGTSIWGKASTKSIATRWQSIGRSGFAILPQVQIVFWDAPTPTVELVAFDMIYEDGGVMV